MTTWGETKLTFLVPSGSFLGDTLKWCTLSSKHLRVKKQLSLALIWKWETSEAFICGKAEATRRQIQHRGQKKKGTQCWMLAYQTVSVCEGLTALPSFTGSCFWPS